MKKKLIVHDFDKSLFTRKTCLKRILCPILYAIFVWSRIIRGRMPIWLKDEKYIQAKALGLLDRMLGVNAVSTLTYKVKAMFPTLKDELEEMGLQVVKHWQMQEWRSCINEWTSRWAWYRTVEPNTTFPNFDRYYILQRLKTKHKTESNMIWHVDHLNYNLYFYLEFLDRFGGG